MSLTARAPAPRLRPKRRAPRWREVRPGEMAAKDFLAGVLRSRSMTAIAERAAAHIADASMPLAVCLDPEGRVTVEAPDDAAETDIIGVYSAASGLLPLYRALRDDLVDFAQHTVLKG
ncbi:hypothetical protein [Luteimonas sp. MHLX1A]|uniref:hypothetical protein n=1 Tax=Alterluteimonas muca TaxID=2878684 RepID=UPI001E40B9EC|nr:hypothetical protein [Luteimonas sp. MHLX1A]MCD9046793.1 hypothetical protein [Luteimonas sp. MHLX1A]